MSIEYTTVAKLMEENAKLRAALEAIKAHYEKDSWAYVYATEALANGEGK